MLILNGFGLSLGDSLIGLQALATVQEIGAVRDPVRLLRGPGLYPLVDALYGLVDFAEVSWGDPSVPDGTGPMVDLRDLAFDPAFHGTAMIDFFLAKLGVAPDAVPAALKRVGWLAPRVALPPGESGYILVCPRSSMVLRDWPEAMHRRVVAALLDRTDRAVLTQDACEPSSARLRLAGRAASIAELCGLVARAAAVVSTDTAMVHLADAFDVPCLAVFTTHRPDRRVRDYPRCDATRVVADGVPDGLEFVRGPGDPAAMARAWDRTLENRCWVEDLIDGFLCKTNLSTSPCETGRSLPAADRRSERGTGSQCQY